MLKGSLPDGGGGAIMGRKKDVASTLSQEEAMLSTILTLSLFNK